jgi:hypothetical protein
MPQIVGILPDDVGQGHLRQSGRVLGQPPSPFRCGLMPFFASCAPCFAYGVAVLDALTPNQTQTRVTPSPSSRMGAELGPERVAAQCPVGLNGLASRSLGRAGVRRYVAVQRRVPGGPLRAVPIR